MGKMTAVIMAICLLVGVTGALPAEEIASEADILFAKYYVNWAWGFDFKGTTVDSAGQVHAFSYPDTSKMPDFDRGALTAAQLNELYRPGKKLLTTVDSGKLRQMTELIQSAAAASMSERVNEGNDMGANSWVAYHYDSQQKTYKQVDLKTQGDWSSHNLATAATEIIDWLNSIK